MVNKSGCTYESTMEASNNVNHLLNSIVIEEHILQQVTSWDQPHSPIHWEDMATAELQNCRKLNCKRIVALCLTCLPILSFMISWVLLENIITWLNERRWVVWSQSFWNELRRLAQDIRSIVGTNTTHYCILISASIFINFWDWCCPVVVWNSYTKSPFLLDATSSGLLRRYLWIGG